MQQITTTYDVRRLGTILTVFAHPDDESFTCAGLLRAAINNGQRVVCLTATKGEIGLQDPATWSVDDLGDVRASELHEALSIIGCTDYRWMGYMDGQCQDVDPQEAINKVKEAIAEILPDTILTFSRDGWTGHLDHRAVSAWVDQAVVGRPIAVYHTALTPEHYEQYLQAVDKAVNVFYKLDEPKLTPAAECAIVFMLPRALCEQKCSALKAHRSQTGRLFDSFDHDFLCKAFGTETFVKAD